MTIRFSSTSRATAKPASRTASSSSSPHATSTTIKPLAFLILGAALTTLGAHVTLPIPGLVPISLQTLGVMLAGGLFGPKLGALSQVLYLVLGACGLPVFANGSSGLFGAGAGYLVTFPVLAHLSGHAMTTRGIKRVGPLFLATLPTLLIGAAWLAYKKNVPFLSGILPYLPGNVLKVAASALILHRK